MKGAMAEPLASTRRAPTATRVITIGASQYFLLFRMNSQSSETTCTFDITVLRTFFRNDADRVAAPNRAANRKRFVRCGGSAGPDQTTSLRRQSVSQSERKQYPERAAS